MGMTAIEKILASHSDQRGGLSPATSWSSTSTSSVFFDSMRPDVLKSPTPTNWCCCTTIMVPAPTVQAANMAKAHAGIRREVRRQELLPRRRTRYLACPGRPGGIGPAGHNPGQRRLAHLLVGRAELPGPRDGPLRDDSTSCARGTTWFLVGPTTKVMLEGSLPDRVYARDVIHYIPGQYGDFAGRNLEWHGDGLAGIGMDGRLTMATISAELSAEFSLFPYDAVLADVPRRPGQVALRARVPRRRRRVRRGPSPSTCRRSSRRSSCPEGRLEFEGGAARSRARRSTRRSSDRAPTAG